MGRFLLWGGSPESTLCLEPVVGAGVGWGQLTKSILGLYRRSYAPAGLTRWRKPLVFSPKNDLAKQGDQRPFRFSLRSQSPRPSMRNILLLWISLPLEIVFDLVWEIGPNLPCETEGEIGPKWMISRSKPNIINFTNY